MNPTTTPISSLDPTLHGFVQAIWQIPRNLRGEAVQRAISMLPDGPPCKGHDVGHLRASFALYWESKTGQIVPIRELRRIFVPPIPIATVLEFANFRYTTTYFEIEEAIRQLFGHLQLRLGEFRPSRQRMLFEIPSDGHSGNEAPSISIGTTVSNLQELIDSGRRFPTIYADPPWAYDNNSSRGAAVSHYPTMSLQEICNEPVHELVEDNAHLHLWTTNGFISEALEVISAWGFDFKSCLVWVTDELGMGNYWRVSHAFLLLGVRGKCTFRDKSLRSWITVPRTTHSRKPGVVRALVEKASPGPYLELYGREELPGSAWTVYGNQVGRQLF